MTVNELIQQLAGVANLGDQVVLAKDREGNSFSPLDLITVGEYEPDTTWSGEFHDDVGNARNALCLWPVN